MFLPFLHTYILHNSINLIYIVLYIIFYIFLYLFLYIVYFFKYLLFFLLFAVNQRNFGNFYINLLAQLFAELTVYLSKNDIIIPVTKNVICFCLLEYTFMSGPKFSLVDWANICFTSLLHR